MFKTADGKPYAGPTTIGPNQQNPAWNNFERMKSNLMATLAKMTPLTAGTSVLIVGVGSGNAAFEVMYAHMLALMGLNVQVVCIDPSDVCKFTYGIDRTNVPLIAPSYKSVPEFNEERAKFAADVVILSLIWPNPHEVQAIEGVYDINAVDLIKPNYIVTMYSTSVNNISGTVAYSADMAKREALYGLSFKNFIPGLCHERIYLIEELIKIIKAANEKCDLNTYIARILGRLNCEKKISPIWFDEIFKEIILYIKICHRDKRAALEIISDELGQFKHNSTVDAEIKLIKLQ